MVTLSRRFSLAFILIVALPSLVVSTILARLYLGALYKSVEMQSRATAEQVAQNVKTETESTAVLAAALFHDGELRRLVDGYIQATGPTERFVWARQLDDKLVSFFIYSNRVGEVVLYLRSAGVYSYSNDPSLRAASVVDRRVCADPAAVPGVVFLLDTLDVAERAGEKHMMSIAVCPAPSDSIAVDAVLLRFRMPYFDALAAGPGGEAGPDVVVLGRSGRPLLSSLPADAMGQELAERASAAGPNGARSSFRDLQAGGRSWLATVRLVESTGWTLLLLTDEAALSRRVTRYQWYLYPALALLTALFIAYAELFFARVAAPIRAIIGHMDRLGKGDYDVRAAAPSIRELAELSSGFNHMVEETSRLQAERERMERDRLTAELEALRYQINPHFITNTLNSIRLMASAARADAIAAMTRDLMRMVSDSYAGAGVLTALSRELASVSAYVGIMKVRFGERFCLEIDAQPGTESLLVLRMILQPIVENSILHGFGGAAAGRMARAARGTIRVTARREERALPPPVSPEPWAEPVPGQVLILEVRDDGAGVDPARLAARSRLLPANTSAAKDAHSGLPPPAERRESRAGGESLHRIGVANVERRIALNFGAPYGLEMESEPGSFTLVRFLLPALMRTDAPDEVGDV